MATITLVGGPCNNQQLNTTLLHLSPGDPIDCGGVRYIWNGGATAEATDQPTAGGSGADQLGVHGPRGWHDLQRTFSRKMPTAVSHAQTYRRAAVQRLRRQRARG